MDSREVKQVQTQFLPESNEYLIRYFGRDGGLVQELRMAADVAAPYGTLDRDLTFEIPSDGLRIPYLVYGIEQATSSNEYHLSGRNLNLNLDDICAPFDMDTSPGLENLGELELGSEWLDEIFLPNADWAMKQAEESDIEEERGGALDEFLDEFKPHNTTPERSDEQE